MTAPRSIVTRGEGVDVAVDRVRPLIHDQLRDVEASRNLRVLFACESGSRAWGFASDDSDFDVRFIYVRPAADYVRLAPPTDAFDLHDGGDFDLAGWDIRKTAELMRKSNAPLLEWLDSPIVYEADRRIFERLVGLRDRYFDPKKSVYHYLSLADKVYDKYIDGESDPVRKKYLYALRPLACVAYIEQHGSVSPTSFVETLDTLDIELRVRKAIDRLVDDKQHNHELGRGPADPVLNGWIEKTLKSGRSLAESLQPNQVPNAELDELLADVILSSGELA
ncbi:MAG: nucleotidyltransferase domain-containing protein [Planctomycetota bacterium]